MLFVWISLVLIFSDPFNVLVALIWAITFDLFEANCVCLCFHKSYRFCSASFLLIYFNWLILEQTTAICDFDKVTLIVVAVLMVWFHRTQPERIWRETYVLKLSTSFRIDLLNSNSAAHSYIQQRSGNCWTSTEALAVIFHSVFLSFVNAMTYLRLMLWIIAY